MLKREDYFNWDETYMLMAKTIAGRSKDPSSQVGAVIVGDDNRVLSLGYNGAPNGFDDEDFPWARVGEELETKYPYVCHGELNAISNYRGDKKSLVGSKIYVTLFPCNECTKLIIQNGIKEVIYACDKYANTNGVKASKIMLDKCNVKYRYFDLDYDVEIKAHDTIKKVENVKIRKRIKED